MLKCIDDVWKPFIKDLPEGKWALLVLDNFSAHCADDIIKKLEGMRTKVLFLPPGSTQFLQPLDLAVNASIKSRIRLAWEQWMVDYGTSDENKTRGGNYKSKPID